MGKPSNPTELQSLPGIGPSLAKYLRDLGFLDPVDLHDQYPEQMYTDLCQFREQKIERCVLYSFPCAVHSETTDDKSPELAKWWNWKGRKP